MVEQIVIVHVSFLVCDECDELKLHGCSIHKLEFIPNVEVS